MSIDKNRGVVQSGVGQQMNRLGEDISEMGQLVDSLRVKLESVLLNGIPSEVLPKDGNQPTGSPYQRELSGFSLRVRGEITKISEILQLLDI